MYEPLPPVGELPVNADGVLPEQIVCADVAVLLIIPGLTVILIADEVFTHEPDVTVLLYQVLVVSAVGE